MHVTDGNRIQLSDEPVQREKDIVALLRIAQKVAALPCVQAEIQARREAEARSVA